MEDIFADMGDRVKKGDILLRLDQREAKLNYEIAQKTLDRNKALLQEARNNLKGQRSFLIKVSSLQAKGIPSRPSMILQRRRLHNQRAPLPLQRRGLRIRLSQRR